MGKCAEIFPNPEIDCLRQIIGKPKLTFVTWSEWNRIAGNKVKVKKERIPRKLKKRIKKSFNVHLCMKDEKGQLRKINRMLKKGNLIQVTFKN